MKCQWLFLVLTWASVEAVIVNERFRQAPYCKGSLTASCDNTIDCLKPESITNPSYSIKDGVYYQCTWAFTFAAVINPYMFCTGSVCTDPSLITTTTRTTTTETTTTTTTTSTVTTTTEATTASTTAAVVTTTTWPIKRSASCAVANGCGNPLGGVYTVTLRSLTCGALNTCKDIAMVNSDVTCSGDASCTGVKFTCQSGNYCRLTCSGTDQACSGATFTCETGSVCKMYFRSSQPVPVSSTLTCAAGGNCCKDGTTDETATFVGNWPAC